MTGASGIAYGIRLLEVLRQAEVATHLIISEWAEQTMRVEADRTPAEVRSLADRVYSDDELDAPPGSGDLLTVGMIVAPCSMRSLAAIAHGISDSLIQRAADVTLKEHRKLVLLVRESPLSVIHLENMVTVARAGAVIAPPMPAFYSRPQTVADIVDHTVGRVLDHFAIPHDLVRRWADPTIAQREPGASGSGASR